MADRTGSRSTMASSEAGSGSPAVATRRSSSACAGMTGSEATPRTSERARSIDNRNPPQASPGASQSLAVSSSDPCSALNVGPWAENLESRPFFSDRRPHGGRRSQKNGSRSGRDVEQRRSQWRRRGQRARAAGVGELAADLGRLGGAGGLDRGGA